MGRRKMLVWRYEHKRLGDLGIENNEWKFYRKWELIGKFDKRV